MTKRTTKYVLACAALLFFAAAISPAFADSFKVIGQGSTNVGTSGWFSGYVIYGKSGNYLVNISVAGSHFPITNIHVIVLANNVSAKGGLSSLIINNSLTITQFTSGKPGYYKPNGGPFAAADYWGYNDTYIIPQLTSSDAQWPNKAVQLPVHVVFNGNDAKIAILCHGMDAAGKPVYTAFSELTAFVVPEVATTLIGLTAFGGAFGLYGLRKYKKTKN